MLGFNATNWKSEPFDVFAMLSFIATQWEPEPLPFAGVIESHVSRQGLVALSRCHFSTKTVSSVLRVYFLAACLIRAFA